MSNSELSAIVLHGIACIGGLYTRFDSNGENGSLMIRQDVTRITRRAANAQRHTLVGTLRRAQVEGELDARTDIESLADFFESYHHLSLFGSVRNSDNQSD